MKRSHKQTLKQPTDAELSILNALWDLGPSTVRSIHEQLNRSAPGGKQIGYTTALKLLQIMAEKQLVGRDASQRAHVYHPLIERDATQRSLVGDLLDRAFDGSAGRMALHALSTRRASAEDLAEIRKLIDDMEAGDNDDR